RIPGFQRPQQALGKGLVAMTLESARGGLEHLRTGQHVAGDRPFGAAAMAAPLDARATGMRGADALRMHEMHLTMIAALVGAHQALDHGMRCHALCEQVQRCRTVVRVDERLGGDGTDATAYVRAQRAHGEEAARDGDAERAGSIARDDGPGHGFRLLTLSAYVPL